MATVVERHGDNIMNAIKFIDDSLWEKNDRSIPGLISEARARFNLSPKDKEFPTIFFKKHEESKE